MPINIENFEIGSGRTFVIAEIGNNHNGSLDLALDMIGMAKEAGADCVKFQMRHLEEVYRSKSLQKSGDDLGTEYVIDLLNKFELTRQDHEKVVAHCKRLGIMYMCTPWDSHSASVINDLGAPAFKVASADLTNMPLIDFLTKFKKPLILSTGMSQTDEVAVTVDFLRNLEAKFVLLHCNSTYPAPFRDINLKWIGKLQEIHDLIGYSGHERGVAVSQAAVALGACVIERHFTVDKDMEGPDHAASLTPQEFSDLVQGIREIEAALGTDEVRVVSQGEMINRENLGKSLVAARNIASGEVLTANDIMVKSPGQGLSPQKYSALVGRVIKRDMAEEDFFFDTDISDQAHKPDHYDFKLPWGIPVRFHDYKKFADLVSPDIFEFHFSYSDMDLAVDEFVARNSQAGFVVHAPELFANSHLLDLAASEPAYRDQSIDHMQALIDITRDMKRLFPLTERPLIVTNIGGFSRDEPLSSSEVTRRYEIFAESLNRLDANGVEIIPQTMAPFPWHFGGQRFQNLFVASEEIVNWCEELNLRICLDVSHSSLTCNHFGYDLYDFIKEVAPLTAHIHIGDAAGVNGEGLQIGEGNIDFDKMGQILLQGCPDASFIPEIWQGHKNNGEGFWYALAKLDGIL